MIETKSFALLYKEVDKLSNEDIKLLKQLNIDHQLYIGKKVYYTSKKR